MQTQCRLVPISPEHTHTQSAGALVFLGLARVGAFGPPCVCVCVVPLKLMQSDGWMESVGQGGGGGGNNGREHTHAQGGERGRHKSQGTIEAGANDHRAGGHQMDCSTLLAGAEKREREHKCNIQTSNRVPPKVDVDHTLLMLTASLAVRTPPRLTHVK